MNVYFFLIKILFILFLFLILNCSLLAQEKLAKNDNLKEKIMYNDATIEEKYFFLRKQMQERFIKIGEGAGHSIPAMIDNPVFADWSNLEGCSKNETGYIRWTDATLYMGDYLAILATEYKIFKKNNCSTNRNTRELYFALKAINRLDSVAEHSIFDISDSDRRYESNGFLVRDDVEADFVLDNFRRSSFFSDMAHCKEKRYNAMSQDQIIGLLFGLRFVAHFYDEKTAYKGVFLKQEAMNITHRLVNYLKKCNWWIRNPVTAKGVPRGQGVMLQSYPIAKAGKMISAQNYQNWWSKTVAQLAWRAAQLPFRVLSSWRFHNIFRDKKNERIIYNDVNNGMMLRLASISNTWSRRKILVNSLAADMEVYALAHAALEGYQPNGVSEAAFRNLLEVMPSTGPFFYGDKQRATGAWASVDRWTHPSDKNSGPKKNLNKEGNYIGLDYMLYFNLYYLVYNNCLSINCKKNFAY